MLVCLLVPASVAFARTGSRKLDCRWLRVERSPETSGGVLSQLPMGCGFHWIPIMFLFCGLSACHLCSTNSQQSPTDSCSNAVKRRQYACHRASTSLLSLAYATASKTLRISRPRATVLSPRELSSMPRDSRATRRSAAVPLADTHSPYAYSRNRHGPRSRVTARGNLTE